MGTSLKRKNLLSVTMVVQTMTFEMSKKINEQNDQMLVALPELCVAVGIHIAVGLPSAIVAFPGHTRFLI